MFSSGSSCQLDFYPIIASTSEPLGGPVATAVADLNADNRLDIAVVDQDNSTLVILLGNGNGSFRLAANLSTGNQSEPYAVAIGDFNNDTRLDIVVANTNAQNIGIFLGNGDGTFQTQLKMSTGSLSYPVALAVGHIDNDGRLDVAVANSGTSRVGIFFGYGNGTFRAQRTFSTGSGSYPISLVIGDFNADLRSDIVVVDYDNNLMRLYLGFANGTFRFQASYNNTLSPIGVDAADFNKDGFLDVAVLNSGSSDTGIFFGNGNGAFSPGPSLSVGYNASLDFIVAIDVDNDGNRDCIIADYDFGDIFIFQGNGDGSFRAPKNFSMGEDTEPYWLSAGDFNNDGRLDLAATNYGTQSVDILLRRC